jgi:hypothetical protein
MFSCLFVTNNILVFSIGMVFGKGEPGRQGPQGRDGKDGDRVSTYVSLDVVVSY